MLTQGVVGILLAAGSSRRFGSDKLIQPLPDGEWVALRSARNLLAVTDHVVAVVRSRSPLVAPLRLLGADVVEFAGADAGMGASLACGVAATEAANGWVIALADMPWIEQDTLAKVVSTLRQHGGIVAPSYQGQRGHPVGFSAHFRTDLLALRGDHGAKLILQAHRDELRLIECDDRNVLRDIDQLGDLD